MSTIVTDTLQGKTSATSITLPTTTNIGSTPLVSASANSMTIRGEGSATTNIQQGLCKAWSDYTTSGSGNSINGSFNVSSISDVGTGDVRLNYTNNMADANYSGFASTAAIGLNHIDDQATDRQRCRTYSDLSTAADRNHAYFGVVGDLA